MSPHKFPPSKTTQHYNRCLPLSIFPWQPDWPGADPLLLMLSWWPGHFLRWPCYFNPFCYLYLSKKTWQLINILPMLRVSHFVSSFVYHYLVNKWLTIAVTVLCNYKSFRSNTLSVNHNKNRPRHQDVITKCKVLYIITATCTLKFSRYPYSTVNVIDCYQVPELDCNPKSFT
jgi:hypothetical protein